jgi:hypothetical protein
MSRKIRNKAARDTTAGLPLIFLTFPSPTRDKRGYRV